MAELHGLYIGVNYLLNGMILQEPATLAFRVDFSKLRVRGGVFGESRCFLGDGDFFVFE